MRITQLPRSILRLQYRAARIPLQLIEERVVARMNPKAPARLVYERSLGVLDATIGSALGDPRLKRRGAALAERSDELARAARLDATADQDLKQADAKLEATREDGKTHRHRRTARRRNSRPTQGFSGGRQGARPRAGTGS